MAEEKRDLLDDLKRFTVKPSMKNLTDYNIVVLDNNVSVGKFIKEDTLSEEELRSFCEKLNDEWCKTVVNPYIEALHAFCEKYEIGIVESDIKTQAMPLITYSMKETMDSLFKDVLGKRPSFSDDED